jgi:hypothetical protein
MSTSEGERSVVEELKGVSSPNGEIPSGGQAGGSGLSFSSLKGGNGNALKHGGNALKHGGNALKHGGNIMDMLTGKHGGNALKTGGSGCAAKFSGGRRRKSASKSRNNRKSRANRRKSAKKGGKKH